jgi:hypothetical protein
MSRLSLGVPVAAGSKRTSVTERRVDIRYVCATCGMETKRTVAAKRTELGGYHLWRFKQVASRLLARTGRGASRVGAFYAR